MKIPSIGDVLEEHGPNGKLWRVVGVALMPGVEEEKPDRHTLYVDVEPIEKREPVPRAFQEAVEPEK